MKCYSNRIATNAHIGWKNERTRLGYLGRATINGMFEVVCVGAKHRLTKPVFDHEPNREGLYDLLRGVLHANVQCVANIDHFNRLKLGVEQFHRIQHYLARARYGLHFAIRQSDLLDILVFFVGQHGVVIVHDGFRLAFHGHTTRTEQNGAVANALYGALVMADQQQGGAAFAKGLDSAKTFVNKIRIAHRQGFVHDQHVRTLGGGHAEGQAHLHAAAVDPHRLVHVVANFGKGLNLGHEAADVFRTVTQQLTGHIGVLTARKVGVKAHTQLEQGCNSPRDVHAAGGWLGGAGDHFQQRAFARAVHADDAHGFAGVDGEVDALQHPLEGVAALVKGADPFQQPRPAVGVLFVGFA